MRQLLLAVTAVLVLGATAARAQSLADVAKKEQERRKTVGSPGKVYTNDTLRTEPPPSGGAPAQPAAPATPPSDAQPPQAGQVPAGQAPAGQAPATTPAPQTEAEWRKRIATEREALSRAQIFAEALQTRINALSTDFVNRDDPAQRDVVAADRQKALAELDRVKKEVSQHQKAITGIQDEARRAGVPAGWVR